MNISFNLQNSYPIKQSHKNTSMPFSGIGNRAEAGAAAREAQKKQREQLRNLNREKKEQDNPYASYSKDSLSNIFGEMQTLSTKSTEKTKYQPKKKLNYNPMQIANKILRARTSLAAGNAVLSARRKLVELKRKLLGDQADSDEVQTALIHAERMELVAKRKKRALENEELVERVQAQDSRNEDRESDLEEIERNRVMAEEDKIADAEDEIFEKRQEAIDEAMEELAARGEEITEELNETLADLGEDLIAELEDQMEALQDMEILNPHMSEEKLEEVKRKHRAAEERAILKANMEYFKATMKHTASAKDNGFAASGAGTGGVSNMAIPSAAEIAGVSADAPAVSIDASV